MAAQSQRLSSVYCELTIRGGVKWEHAQTTAEATCLLPKCEYNSWY